MTPSSTNRTRFLAILVPLVAAAGCAQFPRIDPTGERLFLAPGEVAPPAIVGGSTFAPPAVAAPPVGAAVTTPTFGNVTVPPVYSNAQPAAPSTLSSLNPFAPAPIIGPPVTSTPGTPTPVPALPGAVPVAGPVAVPPRDHLRLLPQRVLAPVGSEVVLRAGVCAASGYLLANQRVEWLMSRDGAGQIVTVGDRGEVDLLRWPWNTPRKIDNWYAIGSTALGPQCLDRGTIDPADDVQILRGESWVTVTSPVEGTSYVTAYAPVVGDWQGRRATATIYWIDAQWVFPPSATVPNGQSHVLTTTVTRRSDGAPLPGYVVRYEVAGDAAGLGYEGGSTADVTTDAAGRASIEVAPTNNTGGTANVNITILRPAQAGLAAGPELTLGQGSTTLAWAADAPPIATTPPPLTTPPTTTPPPTTQPPSTFEPPADQPPPGRSQLEVQVRNDGPQQVQVGDFARFEVLVRNTGDGMARNIVIRDQFDAGLKPPIEGLVDRTIETKPGMVRDLAPGESDVQYLSFEVLQVGQLCHDVTVSDDSGSQAFDRGCVTVVDPTPVAQPVLDVTLQAPVATVVGDISPFKIIIRNTGDVAVSNFVVENRYPAELRPTQAAPGHTHLPNRQLVWQIDRLDIGERREFKIEYECLAQSTSSCNLATVSDDAGMFYADEQCIEILPLPGGAGPPTNSATPPPLDTTAPPVDSPGQPSAGLQLTVTESQNPARVGERMLVTVRLENTLPQAASDVSLRVAFPPEMRPAQITGPTPSQWRIVGQEVQFDPIAEVRPGESINILIPADVVRMGRAPIWAQVTSPTLAAPLEIPSNEVEILGP